MKKVLRRVSVIAATVLLMVSAPAIAQANEPITPFGQGDCFNNHICLWQDSYFEGTLGMYQPSKSCYAMGALNNQVSSLYNRTTKTIRFYDTSNCTGSYTTFWGGSYAGYLTLTGWNDKISSFKQID